MHTHTQVSNESTAKHKQLIMLESEKKALLADLNSTSTISQHRKVSLQELKGKLSQKSAFTQVHRVSVLGRCLFKTSLYRNSKADLLKSRYTSNCIR
jgi:hypothetical protein